MRNFFTTLSILLTLGWLASNVEFETPTVSRDRVSASQFADDWRRTTHGWERSRNWQIEICTNKLDSSLSHLHPAIVASLVGLLGVGILLAGDVHTMRQSLRQNR